MRRLFVQTHLKNCKTFFILKNFNSLEVGSFRPKQPAGFMLACRHSYPCRLGGSEIDPGKIDPRAPLPPTRGSWQPNFPG